MKLLLLITLLAACEARPPKTVPDGLTCYWRFNGRGQSTDGVCFKDAYALQCTYEPDRTPQVKCASGCVPLESSKVTQGVTQ